MNCPVIKLAKQLIKCPSVSPSDEGCQKILIKRLQNIGFTIEQMNFADTKNFWAWRGKGKTLAFAGHTDVAQPGDLRHWNYPPFEPTIRNGMLYGRGAADMKGSLAAMVFAAESFIAIHPNYIGRLAFIITSDEETKATNGTVKVVENLKISKERLDFCLIGEPSSDKIVGDIVKNGRRGSMTANLFIHGVQGHIAYPNLAKNPIHCALPMLQELANIKWDKGNLYFPSTNMQISHIQAGTGSSNLTPSELFVQFNFRFSSELTDTMIKQRVQTLLDQYFLNYSIDWVVSGQPFLTLAGDLLDAVINAVHFYNGIIPKFSTAGGTSDGRFISLLGTQVVELGLVNQTIHKVNECVKATDLKLLSLIYQRIMEIILND